MLRKIGHIGIAVRSLDASKAFFESALGLHCERVETIEEHGVRVAFYPLGETCLEVMEPIDDKSPLQKFLNRRGEGMHHIAFETSDVADSLRRAKANGVTPIHEEPVSGANGSQVAFLHPNSSHGVLTEFWSH